LRKLTSERKSLTSSSSPPTSTALAVRLPKMLASLLDSKSYPFRYRNPQRYSYISNDPRSLFHSSSLSNCSNTSNTHNDISPRSRNLAADQSNADHGHVHPRLSDADPIPPSTPASPLPPYPPSSTPPAYYCIPSSNEVYPKYAKYSSRRYFFGG
jgi:hypothetical protein